MIEITIPIIVGFIALSVGTYTDFKTREVPDWVNYGLIMFGFGISAIYSIVFSSWNYFLFSLAGFGICLGISLLMFYTGQWGGGDSKMLMALGALIGFTFNMKEDFLLYLLINIIIVGGLYGLVWSIVLGIKNRYRIALFWKKFIANRTVYIIRNVILIAVVVLFVLAILMRENLFFIYLVLIGIFVILTFYIWAFMKAIENVAMLKLVKPEEITEGDWIAKDIYVDKKYICGPKDLGINKVQLKQLIAFKKSGKIKDVLIKVGIPFIPSFLIAYIFTIFFGSLIGFFVGI